MMKAENLRSYGECLNKRAPVALRQEEALWVIDQRAAVGWSPVSQRVRGDSGLAPRSLGSMLVLGLSIMGYWRLRVS